MKMKNSYNAEIIIIVLNHGTISLDLCKSQIDYFTIYKFNWLNYFLIIPGFEKSEICKYTPYNC